MPLQPEPAKICYSLGKGWTDCVEVFKRAWSDSLKYSGEHLSNFEPKESFITAPFRLGGTVGTVTGGLLICVCGFIVQGLTVGTAATVRLTITAIFWLLEWLWRAYWKIFSICDDCGHSSSLPAYICDQCGRLHQALLPNAHGIFRHTCICDNKLMSSMFSGRGASITACCPIDRTPITNYGLTPVLIALGGGPRSGKTNFLFRSLDSLIRHHAVGRDWQVAWQDGDEQRFRSLKAQFQANAVRSTPNELPSAFRLSLTAPGTKVDRLLRVYDPGGEAFHDQSSLDTHAYYTRASGAVFLVDPFALPSVRKLLGETEATLSDVMPADNNISHGFERLLDVPGITGNKHGSNVKLAIVLSKSDARGLAERAFQNNPDKSPHEVCRDFLIEHGLSSLVAQAESQFRQVRFFFGGHDHLGTQRGDPRLDAAEPLLWIIDQTLTGVTARLKG